MIQFIAFLDVSAFAARYELTHKRSPDMQDGVLVLRDAEGERPILKEWKGARALLARIRAGAAAYFDGVTPDLGRAWIETLPPQSGTPWALEDDSSFVRTRMAIVPSPHAFSYSGSMSGSLAWGALNVVDHRALSSEVNHGDTARVHLVVDIVRPAPVVHD